MSSQRLVKIFFLVSIVVIAGLAGRASDYHIEVSPRQSVEKLFNAAEVAFESSDYEKSIKIFSYLIPLYDENGNKESQLLFASAFNHYATLLFEKGAYSSAMDYYLKSRRIAEKYKDNDLLSDIFGNIGNIYAASEDYNSAINFYRKAYTLSTRSKDYELRAMLINNLFAANYLNGEMDSAYYYCGLYEKIPDDKRRSRYKYDIHLNKGMLSESMGKSDSAVYYYKKAADWAVKDRLSILCEGAAYSCLAKHYEKTGRLDSAIYYLHAAEALVRKSGADRTLVEVLRDLARVYDKNHNRKMSLEYKSSYLNLADSISFQEEFNKLKNSQMQYELDLNANTISGLNAEKALQRQWLLMACVALIIFGLLTFALIRQKNKLKRVCAELYERNDRQLNDELQYKSRIKDLESSLSEAIAYSLKRNKTKNEEADTLEEDSEDDSLSGNVKKLVSSEEQRNRMVKDILNIMENTDDFCNPDFSLEKLAASIGANPRYVSEVLNDECKKNFRTFLNEYRIKKAMLRLSDTENYGHLTIKAISESVGYKSQGTFITVFTKFTGLKPSLYQKLALEKERQDIG